MGQWSRDCGWIFYVCYKCGSLFHPTLSLRPLAPLSLLGWICQLRRLVHFWYFKTLVAEWQSRTARANSEANVLPFRSPWGIWYIYICCIHIIVLPRSRWDGTCLADRNSLRLQRVRSYTLHLSFLPLSEEFETISSIVFAACTLIKISF